MTSSTWLQAAALITALQGVGHPIGRPWTSGHDPLSAGVVAAMKAHEVRVMGFDRSYFDFYVGFGWDHGVFLAAQAILLWQLAALARAEPTRARPAVAVFFAANLAITYSTGSSCSPSRSSRTASSRSASGLRCCRRPPAPPERPHGVSSSARH